MNNDPLSYILAIQTEVPLFSCSQTSLAKALERSLSAKTSYAKKLNKIFSHSCIAKRHFVLKDFQQDDLKGDFFGKDFPNTVPGMSDRNAIYKKEAPKLACSTAEKLFNSCKKKPLISHIISVSCTGVSVPGIELSLMQHLGLSQSVERLGINFMGCFGAFKGLSVAKAIALENPKHRILLVCTELCSLHMQADAKVDTLVGNALFADGAAAVLVGIRPLPHETPLVSLNKTSSFVVENTEKEMTWEASDTGMLMRLSSAVPSLIKQHAKSFALSLLNDNITVSACDWALHPGGKAILEAVEQACDLHQDQTTASWEILKNYGNMSSASFLFVLDTLLKKPSLRHWIAGLGFGPGLSLEGLLMRRCL